MQLPYLHIPLWAFRSEVRRMRKFVPPPIEELWMTFCGNMVTPGAAEFCTVLVTAIFTDYGVHGEKLQLFCLQQAFWKHLPSTMKQVGKFHHHWFGDAYVWIICSSLWGKWEDFIVIGLTISEFQNVHTEFQAGKDLHRSLDCEFYFEKKVWWLTWSSMASLWELCNEGCGVSVLWRFVTFAGRTRDTNLEVSAVWGCQMRLVFFACPRSFNLTFLKQIENKQPICTNQFSMCFEQTAVLVPK